MSRLTRTKLTDAVQSAFIRIDIEGDDNGDLADAVIIDPSADLSPPAPAMKIDKIQYSLIEFNCRLEFEYTTGDVLAWPIGKGSGSSDFGWFGGMADRATQMGGSGKLKISTYGLGEGKVGSLIIAVTKKS